MAGTALLVAALVVAVLVELLVWRRREGPKEPRDHLRMAERALTKGCPDAAAEQYREAIRLDHENPEAHYGLAQVAWEQGDYDGVIEHLRQCQRWAPEAAAVEQGLGAAHYHKGDHEAAIRHYRRALALDPEDEEVRGDLAALYHELGRAAEAKDVWPEYEPPSAEERDRMERASSLMNYRAYQQIGRWDRAADRAVGVWRVARIGAMAWVLWLLLTLAYELVAGPESAPEPPLILRITAAVAVSAMWAALLILRAMGSLRDSYLRRVLRQVGVSQDDINAAVPPQQRPPWWRVELSGLHLVLWLGLPVVVFAATRDAEPPPWATAAAVYTVLAWILKGGLWFGLLVVEPHRRLAWWERYRWFGTLKGTLFGLVAVPAIVFGCGLVFVLLAESLGML